jgi:acetyl esterase/lipase
VDLKAAVRYLLFNDARIPGDAEKIVSNGTSAGGALSALLGTSGDSADYEADLQALGAALAHDDIFAVSAYCPITNLEHADATYEWQFAGIHDYKKIDFSMLGYKVQRKEVAGTMTVAQISLSNELKDLFPALHQWSEA